MEKKVLEKDKNYALVEYTFDEREVEIAEDRAVRRLNEMVEIPGFRKGRVPKSVLKLRLGEAFKDYVLEDLERRAVSEDEEMAERALLVPMIVESKLEGGKAVVKVEWHLEPEVKVGDYTQMELRKIEKEELVEKYVQRRLEDLREEHPLLEEKEGEAEHGDLVKVKMTVTTEDGKVLRDEEYEYVLYEDDDRPFVKELVGKKKGDVVEFDREYKEHKFHYKIELLGVYRRILRELDDAFAKVVGSEFETLEDLKEKLKEEGEESYEVTMKQILRDQALDWLVENTELEISEKTLERVVEDMKDRLKKEGKYEKLVEDYGGEEELEKVSKERFLANLKETYGIKKVAEIEGIEVTEEELEKEAEELSTFWGIPPQKAKVLVKRDPKIREELEWALLKNKVLDAMIEKAKVVTVSEEEFRKEVQDGEEE